MNQISIVEAIQLLTSTQIQPLVTLDEILQTETDSEFSVWLDGYLVAKHKNGGEIYSHFYVDLMCDKGEWSVSVSDVSSYRTEDLVIIDHEGKSRTQNIDLIDDKLNILLGKMSPAEKFSQEEIQKLEQAILLQIKEKLGGTLSVETISNSNGYKRYN